MTMEMTQAKTGLLMKNLLIDQPFAVRFKFLGFVGGGGGGGGGGGWGGWQGVAQWRSSGPGGYSLDDGARAGPLNADGDHLVTDCQRRGCTDDRRNHPHAFDECSGVDILASDLAALIDREYVSTGLVPQDGRIGEEHDLAVLEQGAEANEGAWNDRSGGIVKDGADAHRAGGGVDGVVAHGVAALEGEACVIRLGQFDRQIGTTILAGAAVVIAAAEFQQISLGDVVFGPDLGVVDDGGKEGRLVGADELAFVEIDDAQSPVDRCADLSELQVQFRRSQRCLGQINLGDGGVAFGLGAVKFLLSDGVGGDGLPGSLQGHLGELEGCFTCRHLGLGGFDHRLKGSRVDGEQQVARFDASAALHVLLGKKAPHPGAKLDDLEAPGLAGELQGVGHGAEDRPVDGHLRGRGRREGSRRTLAAAECNRQADQQHGGRKGFHHDVGTLHQRALVAGMLSVWAKGYGLISRQQA